MNKEEFRKFAVKDHHVTGTAFDDYARKIEDMTQYVIEERPGNFRAIDVFTRLISDRIIFLGMPVDDVVANVVTAQLLFLASVDPKKDIVMYVNSPGGSVTAGLGIYDTMQYVDPEVATICTGLAASMGAVLLAGGTAKKRSALPHARIMIHQPSGGMQGKTTDMEISLKLIMSLREELYTILAQHTGKTVKDIEKDSDKDYWMKSEEAKSYGLIDEVLIKRK
jgi:ATP-dependent Clp protease protease subunit